MILNRVKYKLLNIYKENNFIPNFLPTLLNFCLFKIKAENTNPTIFFSFRKKFFNYMFKCWLTRVVKLV